MSITWSFGHKQTAAKSSSSGSQPAKSQAASAPAYELQREPWVSIGKGWVKFRDSGMREPGQLSASNENAPDLSDKRRPAELMKIIGGAQKEIADGLVALQP